MKYTLTEITENSDFSDWDLLVDESPQGTIFHKNIFLRGLNQKNRYFQVMKGDQVKAGFVLQTSETDKTLSVFHPLVIHNGFFLRKNFVDSSELSRINAAQFELMEFAITELAKEFKSLAIRLSPQVIDIRPLLWLNYHEPDKKRLQLSLRYTSLLDISSINEPVDLAENKSFKALSSSRRQEIRYAIKANMTVESTPDIKLFLNAYAEMARAYDSNIDSTLKEMEGLIGSLLQNNICKVYICRNDNGVADAAAVIAWDSKRAYYMYGVTSKSSRASYSGSFILWEAFRDLQRLGINKVDLEGINSPQRGWFKMSFGGATHPYYQLSF